MSRLRKFAGQFFVQGILLTWLLFILFPMVIVLSLSVRPIQEIYIPTLLPPTVVFDNYVFAWEDAKMDRLFLNSAIVTGLSLLVTLFVSSLAAFAFGRRRFIAGAFLFSFIMLGFLMPKNVAVIPLFINLRTFDLLNSHLALIIPYVSFTIPLAVIILTDFFRQIPNDLEDAGRIDGCTDFQLYWSIMLPIASPALTAVAVLLFLTNWNEFIFATTFIFDQSLRTMPAGIMQFTGESREFLGPVSAAVVISSAPVLLFYLAFQQTFIDGVAAGAVKE